MRVGSLLLRKMWRAVSYSLSLKRWEINCSTGKEPCSMARSASVNEDVGYENIYGIKE